MPAQTILIPETPASVQLIFKTPYHSNKTQFDEAFFLMQLIRRVYSLQDFYTSIPVNAGFKQLKALTEKADIKKAAYKQKDNSYSARHHQKIDTSGFMGKITLNMIGIETLWPYIYLGRWLQVGKNASFGYGRYELLRLK